MHPSPTYSHLTTLTEPWNILTTLAQPWTTSTRAIYPLLTLYSQPNNIPYINDYTLNQYLYPPSFPVTPSPDSGEPSEPSLLLPPTILQDSRISFFLDLYQSVIIFLILYHGGELRAQLQFYIIMNVQGVGPFYRRYLIKCKIYKYKM